MSVFPGFIGGTYTQRSVNVATDRAINLYPEAQEIPGGKTQAALYGRPGLASWGAVGGSGVRAIYSQNGRAIAIGDGQVYEIFANQSATFLGTIAYDGRPATISSNGTGGNQWFITSAYHGYIFDLETSTLTPITDASFRPSVMGGFIDGYFVSLIQNSNSFQISDLEDGTNWSSGSAGTGTRSESSDNIVALIVDHRYLWTLGEQTTLVYYNSGATFPFAPMPSIFIETGCGAPFSATKIDGGLCWLAQSVRGNRYAVRADGPTNAPARISTMGVEWLWAQYATTDDAIGWAIEWQGHAFWYLYFPTANATWVYDASQPPALAWHEEGTWNATTGQYDAHPGQCHCLAFGVHLVGTILPGGQIGRWDPTVYADFGTPIRWARRTAHICTEQVRQVHDRLQVDAEVGVGLTVDTAQGYTPQFWARWSDDGGHLWSNEHLMGMGRLGQYKYRAYLTRLGQTRDRVYEVAGSDPVKTALVAAYLNVRGGTS